MEVVNLFNTWLILAIHENGLDCIFENRKRAVMDDNNTADIIVFPCILIITQKTFEFKGHRPQMNPNILQRIVYYKTTTQMAGSLIVKNNSLQRTN